MIFIFICKKVIRQIFFFFSITNWQQKLTEISNQQEKTTFPARHSLLLVNQQHATTSSINLNNMFASFPVTFATYFSYVQQWEHVIQTSDLPIHVVYYEDLKSVIFIYLSYYSNTLILYAIVYFWIMTSMYLFLDTLK